MPTTGFWDIFRVGWQLVAGCSYKIIIRDIPVYDSHREKKLLNNIDVENVVFDIGKNLSDLLYEQKLCTYFLKFNIILCIYLMQNMNIVCSMFTVITNYSNIEDNMFY